MMAEMTYIYNYKVNNEAQYNKPIISIKSHHIPFVICSGQVDWTTISNELNH